MATTDNKRSVTVGIFVLLAIAILVAGIFILGGKQKRFTKTLRVTTVFDDVSGLKAGGNVWFSGVKIGLVTKMSFYGTSQVAVEMKIEESAQKYIKQDAKARIGAESLIGSKLIEIIGGSPASEPVQDGGRLQSQLAEGSDAIMKTLQENNKNLLAITTDFKSVSAKIAKGEGTAGALLTDSLMAKNFRAAAENLRQASVTTARATAALSQFTAKLNTQNGLANQLMTDTVVFSRLKTSVVQLQRTANSASVVTDNIKQASERLNRNDNALGVALKDTAFAGKLRSTMQHLETSSRKLDQNMEALQHNFLLRGYFRKKAKRDARSQADSTAR